MSYENPRLGGLSNREVHYWVWYGNGGTFPLRGPPPLFFFSLKCMLVSETIFLVRKVLEEVCVSSKVAVIPWAVIWASCGSSDSKTEIRRCKRELLPFFG